MDRRSFFKLGFATSAAMTLTGSRNLWAMDEKNTIYPVSEYFSSTGSFTHEELIKLAQKYGTPLYIYDGDLIEAKYQEFSNAFMENYPKVKVHYAVKANTNINILRLLQKTGAQAECISEAEMRLGFLCGFKHDQTIFTSSSKSTHELEFAVKNNVLINLDSMPDLENLMEVVNKLKKSTRVSFRINPDVNAQTHKNIATGHKLTKFGISQHDDELILAYKLAKENPYIKPVGVHSHIGSQILDLKPFFENVEIVTSVALRIKEKLNFELEFVNLGGGLGIPYRDGQDPLPPADLAKAICPVLKDKFKNFKNLPELWLEPGRYFVAQSGILITTVNSVKMTPYQNFINVDTGFNHLARPLLYDAHHRVRVLGKMSSSSDDKVYQVAGNICETGDILAHERKMPKPERGDFLAFLDTGAYGFSMSSEYNSFSLPAEIMKRKGKIQLIRKRAKFEDLMRSQTNIKLT